MVGEPAFDGGGLVVGEGKDVGEAAARKDDGLARFFGCRDAGVRHYLRRANGGHVGTCGWEGRVEFAAGAVVIGAVGADALAPIARDAIITRGVKEGCTLQTEFHVFVALTLLVEGGQVGFVIAVGGTDDFGCGEAAAGFRTLVAAWERIGVYAVL